MAAGSAGTDAVNVNQLTAVADSLSSQISALGGGGGSGSGTNVTYDSAAKAKITLNAGGTPVTLSNVAAGVAGTDAVNVNQLNSGISSAVSQSNQYTDSQIQSVRGDLDTARRDANGGIASAMAVAGLPQPTEAGRSMLAVSGGTYEGQSGMALGLSTITDNGKWVIKASATTNTRGRTGAVVGAGFQW
ncbi:YadA-like family protein [Herbaspirillum lusitanum]|uniref:YadA-like family protein n=1 Tax=Herbaspirillum lusitanum TaxID=213312 RepID=A0ABW9AD38_9BURK